MTRRRMSVRRARAVIETATIVKAPTWSEDRDWHVVSGDGTVLVVIAPHYRAGRRSGWTWWLAGSGPSSTARPERTCEQAADAGLAAWSRWATTRPSP
ncbi:hypothetical protein ABZ547_08330 [Streptomyces sparsogenes]|uniref:hypothetical protein n=1 Tax=Streptomyces sparsogenes TaxID=67365 RepID=UPI0034017EE8